MSKDQHKPGRLSWPREVKAAEFGITDDESVCVVCGMLVISEGQECEKQH